MTLATGKLPPSLLDHLLQRYALPDARLLVGPRAGEDAAVIDFRTSVIPAGGSLLVAKTDPITFATDEIGWYVVHVNANDIAAMGATPRWFLATVLLPAGKASADLAESIFAQMHAACKTLGIALAGGHTEVTYGLERPVVCGTLLGEVAAENLITTAGARVGDDLVLLRQVPIEGTALIAREKEADLRARGVPSDLLQRACEFLHDPGISIVAAAQLACRAATVHCLHDPTEGGVVTGLWEIARAAGAGLRVDLRAVPVPAESRLLCELYGLDPLGTIASGALLATLAPGETPKLRAACAVAGVPLAHLGSLVAAGDGVLEWDGSGWRPLREFAADEIARIF